MEAPPGFEPGMEVLQTSALPLGDGAVRKPECRLCYRIDEESRAEQRLREREKGIIIEFISVR